MSTPAQKNPKEAAAIGECAILCRANAAIVLLTSALILIPCFWHHHIEAGDLPSHTYNAWLAQLIAKGQAPGLFVVPQATNVLFDVSLYHLGNAFGLPLAEKLAVSAAVLIFFWGVFSFVTAVTGKPPWVFMPGIAMLAYGYVFNMGFINYYLSVGLAFVALSICWRGGRRNWICAAAVALLALLAHPIGFLWLSSTLVYVLLWRRLPGHWRLVLPVLAVVVLGVLRWSFVHHSSFQTSWLQGPSYMRNGTDQLIVYGRRYVFLAYAALAWCGLCFAASFRSGVLDQNPNWQGFRLPLELYGIALCVTAMIPENLRTAPHASWIGLLVSRLTLISAGLGFSLLNNGRPRSWFCAGYAACAAVFFVFLFQDTRSLNRLEENAEVVVATLPQGSRIVPVLNAPSDWRAEFIYHAAERACIEHCFSYANYEPSSLDFRIRAQPGNTLVTSSYDDTGAMASGDYVVKKSDPPLIAIYQCDDSDYTKVCAAPLRPGESVETPTLNSGDQ